MRPNAPAQQKARTVSLLFDSPKVTVSLIFLRFTDHIDRRFVEKYGYRLSSEAPIVIKSGLNYYILDGNHRCYHEIFVRRSRTVECSVWNPKLPARIVKCESALFQEVIEFGIDRAVEAHKKVYGENGWIFSIGDVRFK